MGEDHQPLLKIGLPKGSLETPTIDLFDRAGYNIDVRSRSYTPEIDDPQMSCVMFRAQEMARYVEDGVIDIGITGHDWVVENNADVHEVCELAYSRATGRPVRWVLAVPEEGGIDDPRQLEGKIISTELLNTTQRYFQEQGINVRKVEFSWGATEVKPPVLADAIVDVTETGSSLRANQLRVIDLVQESTPRLIAHHASWADPWKRGKLERLRMLLLGAIAAATRVGLSMNVPKERLDAVLALLPDAGRPTISPLANPAWVDVFVIVEESFVRDLLPPLHEAGARGIVESPVLKIID